MVGSFCLKVNHISLIVVSYFLGWVGLLPKLMGWMGRPLSVSMSVSPPPTPVSSIFMLVRLGWVLHMVFMRWADWVMLACCHVVRLVRVLPCMVAMAVRSLPYRATSMPRVVPPGCWGLCSVCWSCCQVMSWLVRFWVGWPSHMWL